MIQALAKCVLEKILSKILFRIKKDEKILIKKQKNKLNPKIKLNTKVKNFAQMYILWFGFVLKKTIEKSYKKKCDVTQKNCDVTHKKTVVLHKKKTVMSPHKKT